MCAKVNNRVSWWDARCCNRVQKWQRRCSRAVAQSFRSSKLEGAAAGLDNAQMPRQWRQGTIQMCWCSASNTFSPQASRSRCTRVSRQAPAWGHWCKALDQAVTAPWHQKTGCCAHQWAGRCLHGHELGSPGTRKQDTSLSAHTCMVLLVLSSSLSSFSTSSFPMAGI